MADLADAAGDIIEARENHIIETFRNRAAQAPRHQPQGYCLQCGEDFAPESKKLFCDNVCSEKFKG